MNRQLLTSINQNKKKQYLERKLMLNSTGNYDIDRFCFNSKKFKNKKAKRKKIVS